MIESGVVVLACKPKHPFPIFGWLIQLGQRKKYSHFAIGNNEYILHSTIKGVHWVRYEDFLKKYKIVKTWTFLHAETYPMYYWAAKYSSASYSVIQNIGYIFKLLGINIPNPWGDEDRKLNCSELVALWIRDFVHVDIGDSDEYDLIELEKLLNNLGDAIPWEEKDAG